MRACLLVLASTLCAQTIRLSPDGPVRTFTEARDAARAQRRAGQKGNITIRIAEGTYFLGETLVLTPEDSNTTWEAAPGARPADQRRTRAHGLETRAGAAMDGGRKRSGFSSIVHQRAPGAAGTHAKLRLLRIDGPSPQDKPLQLHYRGSDIKSEWAERGDVEVIALLAWADIRMPIVKVDERRAPGDANARSPSLEQGGGRALLHRECARRARFTRRMVPGSEDGHCQYWPTARRKFGRRAGDRARALHARPAGGTSRKPGTGPQCDLPRTAVRACGLEHGPEKGFADTQAATPAPAAIEGEGRWTANWSAARWPIPAGTRSPSGADRSAIRWLPASFTIWAAEG